MSLGVAYRKHIYYLSRSGETLNKKANGDTEVSRRIEFSFYLSSFFLVVWSAIFRKSFRFGVWTDFSGLVYNFPLLRIGFIYMPNTKMNQNQRKLSVEMWVWSSVFHTHTHKEYIKIEEKIKKINMSKWRDGWNNRVRMLVFMCIYEDRVGLARIFRFST